MRRLLPRTGRLLGLVLALLLVAGPAAAERPAELQVIHNAADPAAGLVDIYVNEELFLPDFAFRAATPFVEVPGGVELRIGVAGAGSMGPQDILATIPVTLKGGTRYVAVANGVLDPASFAPNPDGRAIGFDLYAQPNIRTRAFGGLVALRAFHGATDAPAVDIWKRGRLTRTPLAQNLQYGEFTGQRMVFARELELEVTPAGDPRTVVAAFQADLRTLAGGSAVVFASGFLSPAEGQAAFGLFAALPSGDVVELPPVGGGMAELQVIHNAADPTAAQVDIYVNEELFLPDFAFRAATPFVEVPAGVELRIGVAGAGSSGPEDILATIPVTLQAGKRYVAVANGVLDPSSFAPNPDGRSIGFDLFARDGARTRALPSRVAVAVFHGATDAPAVDVLRSGGKGSRLLVENLAYGDFSDYVSLPARSLELDVTPAGDPGTVVASYRADLRDLARGAAVVFASGFLSPAEGQPAFGLFAALPDGSVLELPALAGAADGRDTEYLDRETVTPVAGLEQNFPNPFNPRTTIAFVMAQPGAVRLDVYNVRGERVRSLLDESRGPGRHEVTFDGTGLASGVYFYRLVTPETVESRRMLLTK